ncbi:MAG: TIGR00730 family Rossman fold protein [Bacteroidetes bacterium]|jgi:uncharacterized protein (TIGR00730 family)|nr:TIGR00730 family Rossman fold protein [Bacteroidota bacterium]MBT6686686.1 TIGR00730 family Rossman fold protein [Bacteroidota bacterium]MBT7141824.1 TIGR00730 family Rossman fold protein [Bacteroidota bacterium]MBT7490685.1 TIGR00730 family Rossman fold protein [Bacteroidota bacterium]
MIKKVTVFCASSRKAADSFFSETEKIAKILVKHKITSIYGGGAVGLMGKLADTIISEGGEIIGVIPEFMKKVEWDHKSVKNMITVEDMHERKKVLIENTDAVLALAGGTGTIEELFEVITLKRLGIFTKPIIILNSNNYYSPLIQMLENCIEGKFLNEIHRKMWTIIEKPEELLDAINNSSEWSEKSRDFALV